MPLYWFNMNVAVKVWGEGLTVNEALAMLNDPEAREAMDFSRTEIVKEPGLYHKTEAKPITAKVDRVQGEVTRRAVEA